MLLKNVLRNPKEGRKGNGGIENRKNNQEKKKKRKKTTNIKTSKLHRAAWHWWRDRHAGQCNRIECPEIDLKKHDQLIFNKGVKMI